MQRSIACWSITYERSLAMQIKRKYKFRKVRGIFCYNQNMNKFFNPSFLLRLGLAATILYAAISSFISPSEWIGFFPEWMRAILPAGLLLNGFSVFEIILAAWLLSGYQIFWAGLICAALMVGIIIFNPGALIITFRDIGLAFAALALAVMERNNG